MKEKEEHIEDAVIIDDNVLQETELTSNLPSIPDQFNVDGKIYSIAEAEALKVKAQKLERKVTPKSFGDKKLWDDIFDGKQEAVKMRTTPDNKRKEFSKPAQTFLKDLKAKTDAIGNKAQEAQDIYDKLLDMKANWEEEQERLRLEELEKRTNARIAELFSLDTKFDPSNGAYAFEYAPGTVMSKVQIEDFDDEEWGESILSLSKEKADHEKEQQRLADEKEEEERLAKEKLNEAQKKIDEEKEALLNKQLRLRTKELTLSNAGFADGSWILGGQRFSPEDLRDLTDEEWDDKIELASNPPKKDEPVEAPIAEVKEAPKSEPMFPPPAEINGQPYSVTSGNDSTSVSAPIDPLEAIVQEKLDEHQDHQDKVDGVVKMELTFDPENPFKEIFLMGTSFVRIYPLQFEEAALDINKEWLKNTNEIEDTGLRYLMYTKPKR